MTSTQTADIAVIGLAVMGSNIARNFASKGHTVAVYNRSYDKCEQFMADFASEGSFVSARTYQDLADSLKGPRRALIMVQAGAATDAVIEQLTAVFEPGDIIIDGGNALYTDTIRREKQLAEQGIRFVGAGISGGEEGALNGPAIMPGGPASSYESLGPLLESISAQVDGTPCCTHVGEDGSGHFVKMVHNGIEYADMQLIGEAYDLLRHLGGKSAAEMSTIFSQWNSGELNSYLIEITAEVLAQVDDETGKPLVDLIVDQAGQKGTGRWTAVSALELGTPSTAITQAVFARVVSSSTAQRSIGHVLPGHTGSANLGEDFIEAVKQALYASKLVAYAQGFDQIGAAAAEYNWDINPGELARIWRGGCIIRAEFLDRIREAYAVDPQLPSLLSAPYFVNILDNAVAQWRHVVAQAVTAGVPTPAFSASLAYYDSLRAERLPASLIQGQRDYFGAHTYRRVDKEGSFHTLWSGSGKEIRT